VADNTMQLQLQLQLISLLLLLSVFGGVDCRAYTRRREVPSNPSPVLGTPPTSTKCGVSICPDGSIPKNVGCDPLVIGANTLATGLAINTLGKVATQSCCSSLCDCLSSTSDQSCFVNFQTCLVSNSKTTCTADPETCFTDAQSVFNAANSLSCAGWDAARCPPPPPPKPSPKGTPEPDPFAKSAPPALPAKAAPKLAVAVPSAAARTHSPTTYLICLLLLPLINKLVILKKNDMI